ncbi:MAG: GntR family transcriptional regulator [Chloroflexi bacterium]|nr:GntR family transcriptional regulator [Chloroflexota bacterium]MBV9894171.1 GntR family transcriptional regulator [Chloroflexota bacterium]
MDRDGASSEPLHARVAARVRHDVRIGLYQPGQRLPAEVDLARKLGVSRGTIRQALAALLKEGLLETVPGRGTFVSNQSSKPPAGLIGMVLPSVVRARNPELIAGAEQVVSQAGYSLLLGISGDERALETAQLERLYAQGAAGAIVYLVDGSFQIPELRAMIEREFPVVLIDRHIPGLPVDVVMMDNLNGGFLATQHLIEVGYRRVGYIGTDNISTSSIVERMAGYRWALTQYGLDPDASLVCTELRRLLSWPPREPEKEEHNEQVLREFLLRADRPEAVFVCNDYVAFQVVLIAERLGLKIPDDLAVVGFDNVAYTDYFGVPLTTLEQPRHEIGVTAATLLLERIAGRRTQQSERIVIPTKLVIRRSSSWAHMREPVLR